MPPAPCFVSISFKSLCLSSPSFCFLLCCVSPLFFFLKRKLITSLWDIQNAWKISSSNDPKFNYKWKDSILTIKCKFLSVEREFFSLLWHLFWCLFSFPDCTFSLIYSWASVGSLAENVRPLSKRNRSPLEILRYLSKE